MNSILIIGIVIFIGFILGQEALRLKLPKIIGYLAAGILLNPNICRFIPQDITTKTDTLENLAIAFISFAIGGTIVFPEIKKLGKSILYITLFEAEIAFLFITLGFMAVLPFLITIPNAGWLSLILPASLLLGCMGSPTDPSGALAITHQYKAKGEVSSTVLSVAAFDDVLGIINYSFAIVITHALIMQKTFSASKAILVPLVIISGSVLLGIALGFIFNFITTRINKESEGVFFVLIISFVALAWGIATMIRVEQILAIMIMGIVVANFNRNPGKIFQMMERYSEELIFLIFFSLSGMHLDFSLIPNTLMLLIPFTIFRIIGKYTGTALGAQLAKSSPKIKKYTASGLIPFGGIVIGLALLIQQDPAYSKISNLLVSTIVGATIINEFLGPIFLKKSLTAAGEIEK